MTNSGWNRRELLAALGTWTILPSAVRGDDPAAAAAAQVAAGQWVADLTLSETDRQQLARELPERSQRLASLRSVPLQASDPPAQVFIPLDTRPTVAELDRQVDVHELLAVEDASEPLDPSDETSVATASLTQLGAALRRRQLTARDLATIALRRLERYDGLLQCVVTLTPERAYAEADQADRELQSGADRGPLHGIPWGAKDLIAVPGFPTTWGAPQFRDQRFEREAIVAKRMREAGAVLVAKLSLGALAMGDQWFAGMTRNPWDPRQGSSGSSAGSAAAVAAALVPMAIGSETLGSIVSPSVRCGVVGFRPTFGRVARTGCMPLAWTMDKLGPFTRRVSDAALVFNAIHGCDDGDPSSRNVDFTWPHRFDPSLHRVGYLPSDQLPATDRKELQALRSLGVTLDEVRLPSTEDAWPIVQQLDCEAASVFESLVRSGDLEGLNQWPGIFQAAFFIPATDLVRADRRRRALMLEMREAMGRVTALIDCDDLVITNLTGHPSIVVPTGRKLRNGRTQPETSVLTGRIDRDSELLSLADAFQRAIGGPPSIPPMEEWMADPRRARGEPESPAIPPEVPGDESP